MPLNHKTCNFHKFFVTFSKPEVVSGIDDTGSNFTSSFFSSQIMIGQYSCSAAASSRMVASSSGGYNNYGYLATTEEPRMRPVIYPPQSKLSYSRSMRELTTSSCYYGNNSGNNSDFHSNQLQPLIPANLDNLSEESERNRFQPNEKIKFPALPLKIGSDCRHYWRDDAGSDVIVTSSLPSRQTRALPQFSQPPDTQTDGQTQKHCGGRTKPECSVSRTNQKSAK